MTRRNLKDYHRWDYEDEETEMGVNEEEEMNLEDNEEEMIISTNSMTTFVQPSLNSNNGNGGTVFETLHNSHHSFIHQSSPRKSLRKKIHMVCVILGVFLLGFLLGTILSLSKTSSRVGSPSHHQSPGMTRSDAHGPLNPSPQMILSGVNTNNSSSAVFPKVLSQVTAENIRHNLRRMSQEAHAAGTPEGRSMAMAIRDLWRSYGLSVRFEQHKTPITKTGSFNFLEVYDGNGSVSWRTSTAGDDSDLPNSRPLIAFSPPANLNGTLIYGHFGTVQDFQVIERQGLILEGSIVLLRFGPTHLSQVVLTALSFGVSGLVFYPDPADFGPHLPGNAVRRDSLLSLAQFHDHMKHREKAVLPAHTISPNDARNLLRLLRAKETTDTSPWTGGLLRDSYPIGGNLRSRLRIFNEAKMSTIYNVVAAIPGAWESDRYVIVGCSHDSWTYGAGDPGIGLAVTTELVRSFAASVQAGWRPRRSILFISWDAHLYASSGVSHWLQEHHFEIWSRAVAYIDLGRLLQGNQTLHVVSSPLLREVARKAIQRVKELDALVVKPKKINSGEGIIFSSTLTTDEVSFAFFGNMGIPFIRFSVTNGPKGWDYPLFNTAFDTFDNFSNLVDPTFAGAETLGRIISGLILLLVDSSLLPMNVEDYVDEIQRSFGTFMAHYQEEFHRANLSIAYLQAAVMRLEVIGDNFRTDIHNRSVVNPEHEPAELPLTGTSLHHLTTTKKLLFHRIINDKLMELERAFLSRKSEAYKHQVIGYSSCSRISRDENCTLDWNSASLRHTFPRLRQILECRRQNILLEDACVTNEELSQEVAVLIRAFDAAAATLQSPLLPEESDSSVT